MIYEFVCDDCRIVTDVERPMAMAAEPAACPVCNEPMRRIIHAPAMLNRQKPGSASRFLERKRGEANGWANTYYALKSAEEKGGEEWDKVRRATLSSELREMRTYKRIHGL